VSSANSASKVPHKNNIYITSFCLVQMYDFYSVIWFAISCILVRMLYEVVDAILRRSPCIHSYGRLPLHRRLYVQKNVVKAVSLFLLVCVATCTIARQIYFDNVWNNYQIHRLAVLYVSNDFTGLVCVPQLSTTTLAHHTVSTILVFVSLSLDFQESDIGQAMLVYTLASASSYLVNCYLGLRLLFRKSALLRLRQVAAAIYVFTCGASWSWHAIWVCRRESWTLSHAMYLLLLCFIVRDDLVLMQWLL
jgi:hypothetical protein